MQPPPVVPICAHCKCREAKFAGVHGLFCTTECAGRAWPRKRFVGTAEAALGDEAASEQHVRVDALNLATHRLGREDMGRAHWTAMHTLVGALEDDAETGALSPQDLTDVRAYFALVARLYPCEMCRLEFAAMVKRSPPNFTTARGARNWLASRHNEVNARLGKKQWPLET